MPSDATADGSLRNTQGPVLLLRDVALYRYGRADVRIVDGVIAELGAARERRGDVVIEARGGALLPGLHDHHCHLLATTAADTSIPCGPPAVDTKEALAATLRSATPHSGWVRGVGYDEGVAGELDRSVLDEFRADVAMRVQHRGGSLWIVNSRAAAELGLNDPANLDVSGIERDGSGTATGRLWRLDSWLRTALPRNERPDLTALSQRLASYGVTGVTDATPDLDADARALLHGTGLRQRLVMLGDPGGSAPKKVVVSDHALPTLDQLTSIVRTTRPRAVALHCVTRSALVLSLAALNEVGSVPGDRIEHAAVVPAELRDTISALGLTVVTQPSFLASRGDDYLDRVDPTDLPYLWPFRSLVAAGIGVACSSDAPYGDDNPWITISAAVSRRAPSGRTVVADERVSAARALQGFLSDPLDPGGPPRKLQVGAPADLVLLDAPLKKALRTPSADRVRATMIDGNLVFSRDRMAP